MKDFRESNDFLTSIIDHLPLALFCKSYESGVGVFVAWNANAEALWGLKRKDVIGKSDYDFFPKEQADFFKEKDLEAIRTGKQIYIEEEPVDSPTVGRRIVRTWKTPVNGKYLLGISQDITEQKALEDQLEKQKVIAIHSSKMAALGEMSGGVAHEINNPLAIISGNIAVLEKKFKNKEMDRNFFERKIDIIRQTVKRIQMIIDGLRKFSRDGGHDDFEPISVNEIIDDAISLCGEKIHSKGITFHIEFLDNDFLVNCRKVQLTQVLVNLLNNSINAVEKLQEPWIKISAREKNQNIEMSVEDSGSGIDASVKGKIFMPFFTTKEIGEGTGLGLSISKGLIEDHHGTLDIDETSKNTRFVITLPKAAENKQAA